MSISIGASNPYGDYIKTQNSIQRSANKSGNIGQALNGISKNSSDEELENAVKSFESYFVEQMLKQMKDSVKIFSDDNSDVGSYTDYYMDFAIEEVASRMVEQYGGRLTNDFVAQVKRNYGITEGSDV